ncbi:MAG: hypothetical protein PHW04_15285 [Candidatus Wallbacteria bacterium]|nr:hypothetical protein [Candidatus Wallbacteria bacterium]
MALIKIQFTFSLHVDPVTVIYVQLFQGAEIYGRGVQKGMETFRTYVIRILKKPSTYRISGIEAKSSTTA